MEYNFPEPNKTFPRELYKYLSQKGRKSTIKSFFLKEDGIALQATYNQCEINLFGAKQGLNLMRLEIKGKNKKIEEKIFKELEKILLKKDKF